MTPRRKRLLVVLGLVAGVALASTLTLRALKDNVSVFYDPSQVIAGQAPKDRSFRIGGMVMEGSRQRTPGSMEEKFVVTDFQHQVSVSYSGVLPDLFREGQGVVARGRMNAAGVFVAEEVLAKHDEKYMPPEVKDSLKKPMPATETSSLPKTSPAPVSLTTQSSAPAPSVPSLATSLDSINGVEDNKQ